MIYYFNLSSYLWYSGVHKFCISSIYYFLDSFPGWDCFENMYLKGLMYSAYKGNKWLYNPNIPMRMQRSSHVLGCYRLENTLFLEFLGCVPLVETYIPTNSHLSWNHLQFSVSV